MILELVQEADERDVVVTARPRLEEEATAPEVPPERQAHGEGELRPVEGMDQDGGLPARGPCAADGRPLRDAALVLEDESGVSQRDRKSTRLNSSHVRISYAVFCLKKKKRNI